MNEAKKRERRQSTAGTRDNSRNESMP